MSSLKEEFINIYKSNIAREGSDKLLEWLETTDFFTAPASTKFHCACEHGLLMHSINVYKVLKEKYYNSREDSLESFTICSLLHDICKVQFYKVSKRNVKNEVTGAWEQVPFYQVEDMFPYGHGEKSVFLIERFMKLKTQEAMAIRWHMGGFDEAARSGGFSISLAFDKFPLAVKLHISDLEATYLYEKHTSAVKK
ncbi:MAG: hydrolase [Clostridia bacterium]|nr:hydrolase [Clostridia bacterium]